MADLFGRFKGILKELLSDKVFNLWFSSVSGFEKEGKLFIEVPNEFTKYWLKENYGNAIFEACQKSGFKDYQIVVKEKEEKAKEAFQTSQLSILYPFCGRRFNPRFTFEDFVVGRCNEFAYNVCYNLVEEPPKCYMIYLCGHFGLGKTHLTQAIGNALLSRNFNKVIYFSAQEFLEELLKYLKAGKLSDFKERLKEGCDILLIEKVEFFSGKEFTQNELIFLIDYFLESGKTVVFTSVKSPEEIRDIDISLKSRLSYGLLIKLHHPDFDTRKKIIRHKAKKLGWDFPYEVVEFMARNLRGDVRKLESAVMGLVARASFLREKINLSLAKEVLEELGNSGLNNEVEVIMDVISRFYGVSKEKMCSNSRKKEIKESRQMAIYLIKKLTDKSLKEIGEIFNKEHSTIIYNLKSFEKQLKKDTNLRFKVDYLLKEIKREIGEIQPVKENVNFC